MGPSFLCTTQVILLLIKNKHIWKFTMADWDNMDRANTQPSFSNTRPSFDFLLKLQKLGRMFG